MNFAEKLQLMRKNRGITQEALAEKLCVSRQAVAKWEAEHAYPDIANLIAISEYFLVTVDYLVKDGGCVRNPLPRAGDDEALVKFLITAKQNTYAGKGGETGSSRPNSHDLVYREGEYLYLDTYLGGERFAGEEAAVWLSEKPVYAMNYCGRLSSGYI